MSGRGQALGAIGGAIAGYLIGGDLSSGLKGALYGSQVGAYLDGPPGVNTQGPRINDLTQQTCSYGTVIPRVYGTIAIFGNVFWIENGKLKEVVHKEESDGKGGGGSSSYTTYSYYATFALGLCKSQIAGVRRIWIGNQLFYDAGSTDLNTVIASNANAGNFTVYTGSETQLPDARMQATLGVANTPAYRGLAYIVFKDLPLAKYGNSLRSTQIKVEVCNSLSPFAAATGGWNYAFETSPTGYTFEYPYNYPQNPHDIEGLDNVLIRTTYTSYHVRRLKNGRTKTWEQVETDCYVIKCSSFQNLSYAFVAWYVGNNYRIYYKLNGKLYFVNFNSIANIQISEVGGTVWFAGNSSIFQFKDSSGVKSNEFNAAISPSMLCVRNGRPCSVRMQPLDTYNPSSYLYYIEYSSNGSILLSYSALIAQTSAARRPVGISSTQTSMFPTIIGDYMYCTYISSSNTGSYNTTLVCLIIDINTGQLVRELNIGYDMGADAYADTVYTSAMPVISYHDGIIYATWTLTGLRPKTFAMSFAPWAMSANTSTDLLNIVRNECLLSDMISMSDLNLSSLNQSIRGYKVSDVSSIRSALEPLQGAWPFDIVQNGYTLTFVMRGGSSVASISKDQLDARAYGSSGNYLMITERCMPSTLPSCVKIVYIDPNREFDTNEQYAARISDIDNISQIEMAISLTADEAIQIAERLLYLYWTDRHDVSFTTSMLFNQIEPADIVTVTTDNGEYLIRVMSIDYTSDGALKFKGKFHAPAIYTSVATGQEGTLGTNLITGMQDSVFELLNLPCITDAMSVPGFIGAMCGESAGWPGGVLSRTSDFGTTWSQIGVFAPPGSVIGYAKNGLTDRGTALIDKYSRLYVDINTGSLSSVTEEAMLNGANMFAYGVNGRWEIIAAQNCILSEPHVYILSDLLRGLFGTEANCGNHVYGDKIIALDSDDVSFIRMATASIGSLSTYNASTIQQDLSDSVETDFTYSGLNLECLSPIYPKGSRDVSNGAWNIEWIRRTRVDGCWRDLVDAGLGEIIEKYEVDIFSGSSFTTVKRLVTTLTPSITYSLVDQMADFGSIQGALYADIYQISELMGRGARLRISLSQSLINEPSKSNISLLLHCDWVNSYTNIKDETGKTVTAFGDAKLSISTYKFGTGSLTFDGTGDYFQVANNSAFNFGSGDFTVEFQLISSDVSSIRFCFYYGPLQAWWIYVGAGQITFAWSYTGTDSNSIVSSGTISANRWYHIACVRNGSMMRIYIDGVERASGNVTGALYNTAGSLLIGQYNSMFYQNGYMDEIRITKGVAVYLGPFTPPTAAFVY